MNISLLIRLRTELYFLFICLLLSAVLITISFSQLYQAEEHVSLSQTELSSAKRQYYQSVDSQTRFNTYESQYLALYDTGIFNDDSRLNWLDTINKISKEPQMPLLKYKLNKAEQLTLPNIIKTYPGINIYASNMTLNMKLLHEGDLYHLLNALDRADVGLFNVRKCTLILNKKFKNSFSINTLNQNNIAATCELDWYTLKLEGTPSKRS